MNKDDFEIFWSSYPRRISKGKARKAFETAIKKAALPTMLQAIREYIAHKPARIHFKHPATWLNQECWDDEWEPEAPQRTPFQQHQADCAAELDKIIDGNRGNEQFTDNVVDLGSGDFRRNGKAPANRQ